jgi:hypothetical protein
MRLKSGSRRVRSAAKISNFRSRHRLIEVGVPEEDQSNSRAAQQKACDAG